MTAYTSVLKMQILPGVPRAVWMLMAVLVSLLTGLATYRMIEHPVDEWLKAWWKKHLNSASPSF